MSELFLGHPFIAPVIELARQAGEAILPYWRAEVAVTSKADDSPVTAADLAAHHLILAGLTALDPSIPVLSEEDADIDQSVRCRLAALVVGGPSGWHQGIHFWQ